MKKALILALAVIMVVSIFASCAAEENSAQQAEQLAGGWEIRTENGMTMMAEDVATVWSGGMTSDSELIGDGYYDPIAVLGTQVVAGTNYMFLARNAAQDDSWQQLVTVVIYNDLEGNQEILSITPFNLAKMLEEETSGSAAEEGLAGGFQVYSEIEVTANVSEEDQATFDKATQSLDSDYTAISVLATQVVAGENLAFLAKANDTLYLLNIYRDLQDGASINNICTINLADLTE